MTRHADQPEKKAGRFQTILATLKLVFRRDTPWQIRLILLGAIVYLVSPYDLIPDWLLGFGIVDDLVIVTLLVGWAMRLLKQDTAQLGETGDHESR